MPPYLALLSTLIGSKYPYLEQIFMVPKVFEPLKLDCIQVTKLQENIDITNVTLMNYNRRATCERPVKDYWGQEGGG